MQTVRFQLIFLGIYAAEQAGLVLLLHALPATTDVVISLFVILFFSTFATERLLLEQHLQRVELELQMIALRLSITRRQLTRSAMPLEAGARRQAQNIRARNAS